MIKIYVWDPHNITNAALKNPLILSLKSFIIFISHNIKHINIWSPKRCVSGLEAKIDKVEEPTTQVKHFL